MKPKYRIRDLVAELAMVEPQLAEACRTMTDHTDGLPEPRHLYSATFALMRHPMRMLCTMMLAAIKAGAPLLDVLAPLRALEAWVRSLYPSQLPSFDDAQLEETAAQSALDFEQMRAQRDPSPVNLERVERAAARHLEALRVLYDCTTRELSARRRPTGRAA